MADVFTGDQPVSEGDIHNGYRGSGTHGEGGPAPARGRAGSSQSIPPPKPKPKPQQKQAYVNGLANGSKENVSSRPAEQSEFEEVTSAKSRSFWQQQQERELNDSGSTSPSPPNTIRRSGSIGVRPVAATPSPRLIPESEPARGSSLKKVPPPAPRKKSGSIIQPSAPTLNSGDVAAPVESHPLSACRQSMAQGTLPPSPTFDAHSALESPVLPNCQVTAPKLEASSELAPPPNEMTPSPARTFSPDSSLLGSPDTSNDIHQELKETDDLMADINSMIADFSSELENMF